MPPMPSTFTLFKKDALANSGVKASYDALEEEFALLAEKLKAFEAKRNIAASRMPMDSAPDKTSAGLQRTQKHI